MDPATPQISQWEIVFKFLGSIIDRISNEFLLSLILLCLLISILAVILFGRGTGEKFRIFVFVLVSFFFSGIAYTIFVLSQPAEVIESVPATSLPTEVQTVSAEKQKELERILVPASSYNVGLSINVALGPLPNLYGPDVLMNAPPFNERPNAATFIFNAEGGDYDLFIRMAAASPRPMNVEVNGGYANGGSEFGPVAGVVTGGWLPSDQKWVPAGTLSLNKGSNVVRLASSGVFPHITSLEFVQLPK